MRRSGSALSLIVVLATAACGGRGEAVPASAREPSGHAPPSPSPAAALPETASDGSWVAAQNERTRVWLAARVDLPALAQLARRIGSRERHGLPVRRGSFLFYSHNDGRHDRDVWLVAEAVDLPGRVLLDANEPPLDASDGIAQVWPADDGRQIAYALVRLGENTCDVRIRDVATTADLPETLHDVAADAPLAWAGPGFYYGRRVAAEAPRASGSRVSIWYHRSGTDQAEDVAMLAPADPSRDALPFVSADGRFLIARTVGPGGDGIQVVDLQAREAAPTSLLAPEQARHEPLAVRGTFLYLRTTLHAPRGRILAFDLASATPTSGVEIVPERAETLVSAALVGDRLVVARSGDAAHATLEILDPQGKRLRTAESAAPGAVSGLGPGADQREAYYWLAMPAWPGTAYRLDLTTATSTPVWQQDGGASGGLVTQETRFPSDDGVWVDVTVISRRELRRTGDNLLLLTFRDGMAEATGARTTWEAWLDLGGVLALVDARDSRSPPDRLAGRDGEEASVADLVSAAEWLIVSGFTDTPRLAIADSGGHGQAVAGALGRRPELFSAAVVGPYPPRSVAFLEKGRCYPGTLVVTRTDVGPTSLQAYRLAATLQQRQGCAAPILLRGAGADTPGVVPRIEKATTTLAFLQSMLTPREQPE